MAKDILQRIVETKAREVEAARRLIPESELRRLAAGRDKWRPFLGNLQHAHREGTGIIAEIKRASPSRGVIRADIDPADYARKYEAGGAIAISVLTDSSYFMGSADDLKQARRASTIPVLRKEFVISEYQVYESAVMGADAVLLIARILSESLLCDLVAICRELGMDSLVEIHGPEDMEKAVRSGAKIIGINNRDLKTFDTDTGVAVRMVSGLSSGQIPVAASGINSRGDIEKMEQAGIHNFLVGESIVRAADPVAFIKKLKGGG